MNAKLFKALRGWWDATDHTKDVKLVAYAAVVAAAIVWLTMEQRSPRGITPEWVSAFSWLCMLVGIGGSTWALVEKIKGGNGAPTPPATEGTKDQEGGAL